MHSKKLKFNQLNILKLNNKTYLPYQLHQLPKFFNKYTSDFISIKGGDKGIPKDIWIDH